MGESEVSTAGTSFTTKHYLECKVISSGRNLSSLILSHLSSSPGKNIQEKYTVEERGYSMHRTGYGGTNDDIYVLKRGELSVLAYVFSRPYGTYSDDSEDYREEPSGILYLLEEDVVARALFMHMGKEEKHG